MYVGMWVHTVSVCSVLLNTSTRVNLWVCVLLPTSFTGSQIKWHLSSALWWESLRKLSKDSAGHKEGGGQLCAKRTLTGGSRANPLGPPPTWLPGPLPGVPPLPGVLGFPSFLVWGRWRGKWSGGEGEQPWSQTGAEIPALPPDTKSCGWAP